ncbi:MAG: hypothetical protein QOE70_825 [Chthoniobacter sp.]|jgi:hypothetical protein|nr:hypothetical protein [Chthoniobacter sp.]
MNSTHSQPRFFAAEPLEARIAPALLVVGANYLTAGEIGETSAGENAATLVKVTAGSAVIWFNGADISGISVGPGAGLEISGDVAGDIVANLTAAGRLSDLDGDPTNGEDGGILLSNNIVGIKTGPLGNEKGSIGNIITGGSIANLSISGVIEGIYAGDGVFRTESDAIQGGSVHVTVGLDVNPVDVAYEGGFTFTKATAQFQDGASIKIAKIESGKELQIFSGNGSPRGATAAGPGVPGGNIEGVTISSAYLDGGEFSYMIIAGDGANGTAGGAGGSVISVIEKTSSGTALITAGKGGTGSVGVGGAGGSIRSVDLQSDSSIYLVTAGDGGQGVGGGAGGSLVNANFSNKTPTGGLIVSGDFTGSNGDDVLVIDSGTGRMVLQANDGTGSNFTPVTQYTLLHGAGSADDEVFTDIESLGNTPVAALAQDVNGDGWLDVVVAYRNSNSLGVYLNQGGGSFYQAVVNADPNAEPEFELASVGVALGFTPALLVAGNFSGDGEGDFAVVNTANNKSEIHVVEGGRDATDPTLPVFAVLDGFTEFSGAATAAVGAQFAGGRDDVFVATATGKLLAFAGTGAAEGAPFALTDTGLSIAGGINGLDVDSTGHHLLAVATRSRTVGLYAIGGDGSLLQEAGPDLTTTTGKPLAAHFIASEVPGTADSIALLSSLTAGSRLDLLVPGTDDGDPLTVDPAYVVSKSVSSTASLKTFVLASSNVSGSTLPGIAALGGSLSRFYFDQAYDGFDDFHLPFSGKIVVVKVGNGGAGIDTIKTFGKGGAGGSITAFNVEAPEIYLTAGNGGGAQKGAGGAGGSIVNPASFVTASSTAVVPTLTAEIALEIKAGDGGSPALTGKAASGGAGGAVAGLTLSLAGGSTQVTAGDGGKGRGGVGGAGGSVTRLVSSSAGADLFLTGGAGGAALSGIFAGGVGGSVSFVKHEMRLSDEGEAVERPYAAALVAGQGGLSTFGNGGGGGSVSDINLLLDPANDDLDVVPNLAIDSTVTVLFQAGDGGEGVNGGAGGSINRVKSVTLFDQKVDKAYHLNAVTATLLSGTGGKGNAGIGGNGGAINTALLEGITGFDLNAVATGENPNQIPLFVVAGDGGDGSVRGGAGGAILGLTAQNAKLGESTVLATTELLGASLSSGKGGDGTASDGGKGGDISRVLAGVFAAPLVITTGKGGDGGTAGDESAIKAKGGAGGYLTSSTLGAVVTGFNIGVLVQLGAGGDGQAAGGVGGSVNLLTLNTPQNMLSNSAMLFAGHGGAAAATGGLGGKGGSITGISQAKDLNSAISLLQAGNGGDASDGIAGAGGDVSGVKTAGFIGKPTDGTKNLGVFDNFGSEQGVFSGRGGAGLTDGIAGAVSNITARQIAAIAAAYDAPTDTFGIASKVSNVTADVIGFEVVRDNIFTDNHGGGLSPSATSGRDGFILAAAIEGVNKLRAGFWFTT